VSDLNVAAAQLDSDIDGLHDKVTQTITDAENLKNTIDQAKSTFDSEFQTMQEAASQLHDLVEQAKQTVDTSIQHAYEEFKDLTQHASDAKDQVHQFLQDGQHELENLMQHAQSEVQPTIEQVLQHIQDVHSTFADRIGAIHDELGSVVSDAHEFLTNTTVNHLNDMKSKVEQTHEQVHNYVTSELVPQIQGHVEDYMGQLQGIGGQLQEHFNTAKSNFHDHASNALQTMMSQYTQHNENAKNVADQLQGVMDMFKGFIDTGGDIVATGETVVQTGVDTTNIGLNGIVDTFMEIKEFFGRFSFISI